MIAPLPETARNKPGCAALPLPGVDAAIVDEAGRIFEDHESGRLIIQSPWPGILKGIVEIESALLSHESVVEAAVVGMPHSIKGQCIYA